MPSRSVRQVLASVRIERDVTRALYRVYHIATGDLLVVVYEEDVLASTQELGDYVATQLYGITCSNCGRALSITEAGACEQCVAAAAERLRELERKLAGGG